MAVTPEFWTNLTAMDPREGPVQAQKLEADGWDGAVMVDSQCIFPEVWTNLALCAHATSRIKLGTGVTNPITRHPSITAAAAASVQVISEGRASLGIGRGDSALAYIGASPMRISEFERYLELLQTYLRGQEVPMEEASALLLDAKAGFGNLAIGTGPSGSSLKWLAGYDLPKVPLEAFATGPKAIAAAARAADSLMLAVSAEPNRVSWGVDLARTAAAEVGRHVGVGCMLVVTPHENAQVARDLARAQVATQARFAVMNHKVQGPVTDAQAETLRNIAAVYDMNRHAQLTPAASAARAGAQSQAAPDEFVEQFGVVGSVDACVSRLKELAALGVDRMSLWVPYVKSADAEHSYNLLVNEVLPQVRAS